ncbi:MAG: tRNA pseudouridine(65) synthase TruC [Myxococcales bacterium]|nr:tRNA pseudouridine(65) synthase TruC [Myxococcales bacterium]
MSATDEPRPLPVLYRDDRFVAVDKPPGLLVHRSPLARGETEFAVQRLRDQLGQRVYPVHRLDRPTSGVLVFALDPEAASALAERFAAREVTKRYLAVVRGWLHGHLIVDHPLRALGDEPSRAEPLAAETEFDGLATARVPEPVGPYPERRYGLVLARPRTGRRHQIRRHLKHLGHPIIGDVRHGKGAHNRFFRERLDVSRLLLAAISLGFDHPFTRARVTIEAPPGLEFSRVLTAFGWRAPAAELLPRDPA